MRRSALKCSLLYKELLFTHELTAAVIICKRPYETKKFQHGYRMGYYTLYLAEGCVGWPHIAIVPIGLSRLRSFLKYST